MSSTKQKTASPELEEASNHGITHMGLDVDDVFWKKKEKNMKKTTKKVAKKTAKKSK